VTSQQTQVLIVGAGPAGLAHAIELGRRGIRCVVVERNDRVGYAPRAKSTNVRTREHLRRWGIAARLRERSPLGIDYPSDIVFATRMTGHLLARIENAFYCAPAKDARYAEHAQWIPQYTLEEVLREHAESLRQCGYGSSTGWRASLRTTPASLHRCATCATAAPWNSDATS
jgi:2-polyprenyl-6-methoxyphenol hydroxylase-like FAD-dependent oxidoreductase